MNRNPAGPRVEATRGFLDDATEVNTKYFQAWVAGAEGALKASFEFQTAALYSGQQAVLDAFKAQMRATARLAKAT